MKWRCALALLAVCAGLPSVARADAFDPISFGASASTLGYGITLERPLLFNLSARIASGWLDSSTQQTFGDGRWTSSFHESNILVAMDWRPYAGRWRLSAGLLFGSDHTDKAALAENGSYVLNGNVYPAAGSTVTGTVSYAHPTFYVGVGAGSGIVKGLTIAFEVGVVLRNGSTTINVTGPLSSNALAQADAAAVAEQFKTRWLQPVASVGLLFRP